jgi:hypothetical protein
METSKVHSISGSKLTTLKLRFHGRANPSCSSGEQKICLAPLASELHVTFKSGKRLAARWICTTVETRLKLSFLECGYFPHEVRIGWNN